jgi:predicted DNA-binding antitoxin AbrB/MazE fold protein
MSLQVEATYEDGVLRPDQPLPLAEKQRVTVVVQAEISRAKRSYGLIGFKGDPEIVRKIALDSEFGVADSP